MATTGKGPVNQPDPQGVEYREGVRALVRLHRQLTAQGLDLEQTRAIILHESMQRPQAEIAGLMYYAVRFLARMATWPA